MGIDFTDRTVLPRTLYEAKSTGRNCVRLFGLEHVESSHNDTGRA